MIDITAEKARELMTTDKISFPGMYDEIITTTNKAIVEAAKQHKNNVAMPLYITDYGAHLTKMEEVVKAALTDYYTTKRGFKLTFGTMRKVPTKKQFAIRMTVSW